jgi:hypothetical protein
MRLTLRALPLLVALAGASLVGVSASSASSAAARGVRFPPQTPHWIALAATQTVRSLGDADATVVSLRMGRFPIIVLHGNFRCTLCSRPSDSTLVPTGHYAALRFDAVSHETTDFGLTASPQNISSDVLCGGTACASRKTIALDSALRAMNALRPTSEEPFGIRLGRSRCQIRLPGNGKLIRGGCSENVTLGKTRTVVTFNETWTGLDRFGRRYSPLSPVHHHRWQLIESQAGWVTKINSSGDFPPQWTQ